MKTKNILIISAFFIIGLFPVFYKTIVLGLPFYPSVQKNLWSVEYEIKMRGNDSNRTITFPVPQNSNRIKIKEVEKNSTAKQPLVNHKNKQGNFITLKGKFPSSVRIHYKVILEAVEKKFKKIKRIRPLIKTKKIKEYLELPQFTSTQLAKIKDMELENIPATKNKLKKLKAIYYFIHEEVSRKKTKYDLDEILNLLEADYLGKSKLFMVLSRRIGIPTRVIGGIRLMTPKKLYGKQRKKLFFWNEVFINHQWVPVCTFAGHFGSIPFNYIPLFIGYDSIKEIINDDKTSINIFNQKILSQEFSLKEYRKEIKSKDSFFIQLSLFMLPIKIQHIFKILLLIPLGAVILAFFRNIIGLQTFGIFMPILLSLFFKETSFFFGFSFFTVLILLGVLERLLLEKLHLLVVPRLSIILSLVVLFLVAFTLINHKTKLFSQFTPALFPIVITTIFIERFSIMVVEEGYINTFKNLLGTFFISLICFFIFSLQTVQVILFTYPELLFVVIALLIMIGRYTNYRVLEIIRFRDLNSKRPSA